MADVEAALRVLVEALREELLAKLSAELATVTAARAAAPAMVTMKAYAAARSISLSTVRAAVKAGRLKVARIGRAVRIPADAEIGPAAGATETGKRTRGDVTRSAERTLGIVRGRG